MRAAVLACSLFVLVPAVPGAAQTIVGRVLDEANETPVAGVIVMLVDRDGEERLRALSDSAGRFLIEPPEAGEYTLVAERFGYSTTRSPLLALSTEGEAPLELMVTPEPVGLEGLEVNVEEEATEELSLMGISPVDLGQRWITREQIETIQVKADMGVILERIPQPGLTILRADNQTTGSDDIGLCISMSRANRAGVKTCAMVVWNGLPLTGMGAMDIDPESIENIAVLWPSEASLRFGPIGGNGAVLVWTRSAR